jgi:protein phosphatase 4 regulatory subunit 3
MLNDHSMYEHILDDDMFFGVVGMLECSFSPSVCLCWALTSRSLDDPEFPTHKANYRSFLNEVAHFHQPIPIRDEAIQKKVHNTYRLQFLKDVVLARALDDSTFNVLNSCIIFNQIDIITHVQQDPIFLRDVVKLFVDEEVLNEEVKGEEGGEGMDVDQSSGRSERPKPNGTAVPNTRSGIYAYAPPEGLSEEEISLRREVILLIQQLSVMGKNVQLPARMTLFRTLVDRGILFAVQWAIGQSDKDESSKATVSAGGEILAALLDHDLNGVRGHVLRQMTLIEKEKEAGKKGADKAETILALACRLLATSRDIAVQSQIGDALKVWLEVQLGDGTESHVSMYSYFNSPDVLTCLQAALGIKLLARGGKDELGTQKFLDYFYKNCVETLFKPFNDIPDFRTLSGETSGYFYYIVSNVLLQTLSLR